MPRMPGRADPRAQPFVSRPLPRLQGPRAGAGPAVLALGEGGVHTDAYQGELAAVFGAAGAAAGHAVVLAEYRRLMALQDNAARCGVLPCEPRSVAADGRDIDTHTNNHPPGRAC